MIRKISIYCLLFAFIPFANSCSNDDDGGKKETIELICGEEGYAVGEGNICCIYGSDLASPGETLSYEYESSIANPIYDWVVHSGAIRIVSGRTSAIVTLEFGNDFTRGEIVCHATEGGGFRKCGEKLIINKK